MTPADPGRTGDYLNGDDAEHELCMRGAQSGQMRGQSAAIRAHVNGTLTDVTANGIDNLHTRPDHADDHKLARARLIV